MIKPTMPKCDEAAIAIAFYANRALHKAFMDKVIAEGYTLGEALSLLMLRYIEGE